jgi:hypothetical protein
MHWRAADCGTSQPTITKIWFVLAALLCLTLLLGAVMVAA